MRITALAGGIGGARFLRGLREHVAARTDSAAGAEITVIGNTGDDLWLHGLRVCPDLDTVMYTLGGGIDEAQGWGRAAETFSIREELAAYDVQPRWFTLGDRDIATHLVRTPLLRAGYPLSQVTEALCARWQPGVRLLPMTDDRVETHVVIEDAAEPSGQRVVHFQEWWVRMRAAAAARAFVIVGIEDAKPAPGVLEAIAEADVVLLPPSNPVVSIGTILAVPGIREALRSTAAPGGGRLADRGRRAGARDGRRVPGRDRRRDERAGGRGALRGAVRRWPARRLAGGRGRPVRRRRRTGRGASAADGVPGRDRGACG